MQSYKLILTTKAGRNRIVYGLLTVIVLTLGLLSRRIPDQWSFIRDAVGDGLWAMMVFFGFALIFNRWSSTALVSLAILFSFGIELSQLYHAPWIDSLRATRMGGLVLGYSFVWIDLLWYTLGILVGLFTDRRIATKTVRSGN